MKCMNSGNVGVINGFIDDEFQLCVTSYETLTVDEKYFSGVKWHYLDLHEAQSIKNSNSAR